MTAELEAAYRRLYEAWWHETGVMEGDCPGYSLISDGEVVALDEACKVIEDLLVSAGAETMTEVNE